MTPQSFAKVNDCGFQITGDNDKPVLCVTPETLFDEIVIPKEKSFEIIAKNAHDLKLTAPELHSIFDGKFIKLRVEGICAGVCSRLLLPFASEVSFAPDSFILLSNSSVVSKGTFIFDSLGVLNSAPPNEIKINGGDLDTAMNSYAPYVQKQYFLELQSILATDTSIYHLQYHSFVHQKLATMPDSPCPKRIPLYIILTPRYLKSQSIFIRDNTKMPDEKSMVRQITKTFGKSQIVTAFEETPLTSCPI